MSDVLRYGGFEMTFDINYAFTVVLCYNSFPAETLTFGANQMREFPHACNRLHLFASSAPIGSLGRRGSQLTGLYIIGSNHA